VSEHNSAVSPEATRDTGVSEIRARLAAATKGPWLVVVVPECDGNVCIKHEHFDLYRREADVDIVRQEPGFVEVKIGETRDVNVGCFLGEKGDAEFIAHAPADMEWLLDELARERRSAEFNYESWRRERVELLGENERLRAELARSGVPATTEGPAPGLTEEERIFVARVRANVANNWGVGDEPRLLALLDRLSCSAESPTLSEIERFVSAPSDAVRLATFAGLLASRGNYRDLSVVFSLTPPDGGAVYVEIDGVRCEGGDPLEALRRTLDAWNQRAATEASVRVSHTVNRPDISESSPAAVILAAAEWLMDSENRARGMGYTTARDLANALKSSEVMAWAIAQRGRRSDFRAKESV
jgi:hypothetical protein